MTWSVTSDNLFYTDSGAKRFIKKLSQADCTKCSRSCLAPSYGFFKIFRRSCGIGRNRPLFAIRAHYGLFGTSMSRNFWVSNGILRKSHIPTHDSFGNILCNLPSQLRKHTFFHLNLIRQKTLRGGKNTCGFI